MLTKMAKTPTYTQKQQQQQKQDVALKHCVCMSSDSLRMQTLADRAPKTWCPLGQIQTAILCQTPP
jgi:hypothetical protein